MHTEVRIKVRVFVLHKDLSTGAIKNGDQTVRAIWMGYCCCVTHLLKSGTHAYDDGSVANNNEDELGAA
jgi:hypothetical protein